MCFFSRTHAPFTVVLNQVESSGRTLDTLNTFATNFFQCLEQGPRFVYNDLDLEYKPPAKIITTTEAATPRTISGNIFYPKIPSITPVNINIDLDACRANTSI